MRKQYKRVLASAMAAILIWNTCGWQVPALAASVVYQVEEIEQLPEEVLYQEVPYGTKYKDLELPDKLKNGTPNSRYFSDELGVPNFLINTEQMFAI